MELKCLNRQDDSLGRCSLKGLCYATFNACLIPQRRSDRNPLRLQYKKSKKTMRKLKIDLKNT